MPTNSKCAHEAEQLMKCITLEAWVCGEGQANAERAHKRDPG